MSIIKESEQEKQKIEIEFPKEKADQIKKFCDIFNWEVKQFCKTIILRELNQIKYYILYNSFLELMEEYGEPLVIFERLKLIFKNNKDQDQVQPK